MPAWLSTSWSSEAEISVWLLIWRTGVALALGAVVGGLYKWARRGESTPTTFVATLILLSGLLAMATQVIGDNMARAFGLVGALSVVRFRTVVKDTQDTAFVILAVVVGMSAGASHLAIGVIGLGLLVLLAPLLWPSARHVQGGGWGRDDALLRLKIEHNDAARTSVDSIFQTTLARHRLLSVSTAKKGAALDLLYSVRLRPGGSPIELIAELNRIDGVSGVDLSRAE